MQTTATAGSGSTAQRLAKSPYRPEIDGLRAFAVVAVIINHFNKDLLPSGYLGVDIFFVISGYVITSSLANHRSETFGDFFLGFYARRVKRLVPALVVFVLITSVLICLFNPDPGISLGVGRRALFGLSNITLYRGSTNYFAQSTELNPFTHTWSLGVEEQFYLLFPFLIWFSGFGRGARHGSRNLFVITLTLSILSLASFIWLYPRNQPAAYFLMPPRIWELGVGCLLFLGLRRNQAVGQRLPIAPAASAVLTTALISSLFLPQEQGVVATVLIAALTVGLIASLRPGCWWLACFKQKKLVFIGLISYSLYLWHWVVLCISRWTVGIHWWSFPFQLLLMFALAIASYHWVEKPCRSPGFLNIYSTVVVGAMAIVISSVVGLQPLARSLSSGLFLGHRGMENLNSLAEDGLSPGSDSKICYYSNEARLLPNTKDFAGCWTEDPPSSPRSQAHRRIFAYGNSYNKQLMPLYAALHSNHPSLSVNSYFSAGCPASLILFSRRANHCPEILRRYLTWVNKNAIPGDNVILATSLGFFVGPKFHAGNLLLNAKQVDGHQALNAYQSELINLSSSLRKKGVLLFVVSGIPLLKGDPLVCSQWFAFFNDKCQEPIDQGVSDEVMRVGLELQKLEDKGIGFINIYDKTATMLLTNRASWHQFYHDYGHLSAKGATVLQDIFEHSLGID